ERQRVPHRQDQNAGAEADPSCKGCRPSQRQDRVVKDRRGRVGRVLRDNDVLARPHVGKSELLRLNGRPPDRLRPRLATDLRQMNPDPHLLSLQQTTIVSRVTPAEIGKQAVLRSEAKAAPRRRRHSSAGVGAFYMVFRRRSRPTPKRAVPRRMSEAGSGTPGGSVTTPLRT